MQYSVVKKMRQFLVLILSGVHEETKTERSLLPWANWHLYPNVHSPVSNQCLHISYLYFLCDLIDEIALVEGVNDELVEGVKDELAEGVKDELSVQVAGAVGSAEGVKAVDVELIENDAKSERGLNSLPAYWMVNEDATD